MSAYYSSIRKSIKWYKKIEALKLRRIALKLICGTML